MELEGLGRDLARVAVIDISGLDARIKDSKITLMCDVTNPLCGKDGATWTFGKQKGATPEIQEELEKGMCSYRAAGGLGAALMVFLEGEPHIICRLSSDFARKSGGFLKNRSRKR